MALLLGNQHCMECWLKRLRAAGEESHGGEEPKAKWNEDNHFFLESEKKEKKREEKKRKKESLDFKIFPGEHAPRPP